MATVRIETGPVSANDYAVNIPREEWWYLVAARRSFCRVSLPSDCRHLLRFVAEAERFKMWEHEKLRANGLEEFVRRHLDLDPEMVQWAIAGLKSMKPNEAIPLEVAVREGKLRAEVIAQAAGETDGKVLPRGGDVKSEAARSIGNLPIDRQSDRALAAGVSVSVQKRLDALARVRPDLLAEVRNRRMSAHAAALEAGIVKPPDRLRQLCRLWSAATPEQRAAFFEFIALDRQVETLS